MAGQRLELYRHLRRVRLLDERLVQLQRQGRVGFHGSCAGQEAAPVAAGLALRTGDWIFPALRESYVMLVRGYPLDRYLAQDFGSSRWLIGGTQDNGSQRWSGSQVWDHVADGDGGDCGVNRTTPRTVSHTYYGMSPERSTTAGNFGSWTWIAPPVPAGEGSPFYPPFECSASGGDTIAIGGR